MTDYIGITEAQSNPFAPLTSELVKQLRDNPIAIAEGAVGAPRILGTARVNNLLASGNLPTGVNAAGVSDLIAHSGIFVVFLGLERTGGTSSNGVIEFSANNGGSWSDISGNTILTGDKVLYYERMANLLGIIAANFTSESLGTFSSTSGFTVRNFTIPESVNAVRVRFNDSEANFSAGTYAVYGVTRGNE